MLSIKGLSQDSANYYIQMARGDYYHKGGEPPGHWYGEGAAKLGLTGIVEPDPYYRIFFGKQPDGAGNLIETDGGREHHPGWDLTFSAPKSVSVIWSQADDELRQTIQDCQERAAQRALDYLQDKAAVSRRGKGGVERVKADLVVANFEHGTSRANDPELHTHSLVFNVAVLEDGTIGALAGQQFYRHKMAAGAVYRTELAHLLQAELGLEIEQHGTSFEVKGVPKELLAEFSKRREAIKEALTSFGVESAQAAAIATLETRTAKEHVPRAELLERWQEVGREHGFSRDEVMSLVNRDRGHRDRPEQAVELARAAAADLLSQNSHFTERDLVRLTAQWGQWRGLSADQVLAGVERQLQSPEMIYLGEVKHEAVYTSAELLALERAMLERAEQQAQSTRHVVPERAAERALAKVDELSDEQRAAVRHITIEAGEVKVIDGLAGTGKTKSLAPARELWEGQGYRVLGAAVSGKAARGLEAGSGIPSTTLAGLRLQNEEPSLRAVLGHELHQVGRATIGKERSLDKSSRFALDADTVLVVDEASMVATRDLDWLVTECERSGAKLVLVGDRAQLPAIGSGGGYAAIGDRLGKATLTGIERQREDWAREAVGLMAQGRVAESLAKYTEHDKVTVANDRREAHAALIDSWRQEGVRRPEEHVIFAATNQEAALLNRAAQRERKLKGQLGDLWVTVHGEEIRANDRVVFTKNSATYGVVNGMTGTVLLVEPLTRNVVVKLDHGKTTTIPLYRYDHLDLGYALTTHKGQGMTVENAYVLMGGAMQDREMAYVQVSRARGDTRLFVDKHEAGPQHAELIKQIEQSHQKQLAATLQTAGKQVPPEPQVEPPPELPKEEPRPAPRPRPHHGLYPGLGFIV